MTDCEKYGMAHGCDADCPVLQAGNCKNEESLKTYQNEHEENC